MGRCYEFGISIDPSSERAMIVAPEGGHCHCPATGVTCAGRFDGCGEITAIPGRIPAAAPSWSLPSNSTNVTRRDDSGEAGDRAGTLQQLIEVVEAMKNELSELHRSNRHESIDRVLEAVATISADLARDTNPDSDVATTDSGVEALEALTNLSLQQSMLSSVPAQLTDVHRATESVAEAITTLQRSLALDESSRDELRVPVQNTARAMIELRDAQTETTGVVASLRRDFTAAPNVVAATELAETINTLRQAGIAEISSAHLIHSLQVEMRTLRDEMSGVRRALTALVAGPSGAETVIDLTDSRTRAESV